MYEFFYDILQPHYDEGCLILPFMDTDSFIYSRTPKIGSTVSDLEDSQEKNVHTIFQILKFS